jgi:hypothetical protein
VLPPLASVCLVIIREKLISPVLGYKHTVVVAYIQISKYKIILMRKMVVDLKHSRRLSEDELLLLLLLLLLMQGGSRGLLVLLLLFNQASRRLLY